MQLINALVTSPEDLDFRIHLRNEFLRCGLKKILPVSHLYVGIAHSQLFVIVEDNQIVLLGIADVKDLGVGKVRPGKDYESKSAFILHSCKFRLSSAM